MITVPQNETNEAKPLLLEKNDRCHLCAEKASIEIDGMPLCGIPGNHPDYDDEKILN